MVKHVGISNNRLSHLKARDKTLDRCPPTQEILAKSRTCIYMAGGLVSLEMNGAYSMYRKSSNWPPLE